MIVALIVAGRLLLRPVLRYVANTRQREIFVGFALMLVIGVAALMEMVGLSTALGAFLGGVLLADSEYRHTLELDIEPFKGLLLGLFFIAVGMSVDLGLFVRSPAADFPHRCRTSSLSRCCCSTRSPRPSASAAAPTPR